MRDLDIETRAALEAIRAELDDFEQAIANPLQIALSQPEGELRDRLVDQVSCLASIADVMRRALDSAGRCS